MSPQWGPHEYLFVGRYYAAHVLRPKNNESGEPEIDNIREKFQDNNEFILNNNLRNSKINQITEMIQ